MLSDQPYRYLTVDEMKSLGDDSLPIDVTRDERADSNRMMQSGDYVSGVVANQQAITEVVKSPLKADLYTVDKSAANLTYMGNTIREGQVPIR